jgi:histidine triad (HIT) family protein
METPRDVASAVLGALPAVSKAVAAATGAEGINLLQNNHPAAGQVWRVCWGFFLSFFISFRLIRRASQEVPHVHFHIVPRIGGDGLLKFPKSGPKLEPAEAAPTIAAIKEAL